MTEENLPRLRATRAGNKGVVTKLIGEAETILDGIHPLEEKARNRLARIERVLKEKSELIHDLDEKIIAVCKVEDIEKEIEDAEDLKMRVMDAIEAISLGTTPQLLLLQMYHLTSSKETTPFLFLLHHLDRIQRVHSNLMETLEQEQKLRKQLEQNCLN